MKILLVIGTRPEAIKMAPIILNLKKEFTSKNLKVCVTAQHRKLLDDVLKFFKIKPDYDLNIMKSNQDLFDISISIFEKLKFLLNRYSPDLVLVHGDTTTTMITTLASFYKKIKIGHIESGLRTHNLFSPWPEECNRQITDLISSLHFVPTQEAKKNIIRSRIKSDSITVTGNTVIDALLYTKKEIQNNYKLQRSLINNFKFLTKNNRILLVTCHRRENFGKGINELCKALKDLIKNNNDLVIVFPVHPNPNIKKFVFKSLNKVENIKLIDPVNYVSMVYLMMKSHLIITDSGGIQEEAPSLNKPLLILRDETERPEVIKLGAGKLIKKNKSDITLNVERLLSNKKLYKKMSKVKNPYGDGRASIRIINVLKKNMKIITGAAKRVAP